MSNNVQIGMRYLREDRVAIIDNGINSILMCKEKIQSQMVIYDNNRCIEDKEEIQITDFQHGTFCALIFEKYNSDCILNSVRILDKNGKGGVEKIEPALEWCYQNNIKIVNLSFGTTNFNECEKLKKLINKYVYNGMIIVAATANSGFVSYPASFTNVIGVATTGSPLSYSEDYMQMGIDTVVPSEHIIKMFDEEIRTSLSNSYAAPYACALIANRLNIDKTLSIKKLKEYGVTTKILTGDNQYATENICNLVGIENKRILIGTDVDKLSDEELSKEVEEVNVFARMNPLQKERIIKTLKKNGHVVGYMGDGVNDAPSLHNADVGICVNTATDIAKEASDIILLEKSLKVIFNGVIEGRKVYGNIIKYMKMALSSDFGDVFSIFIASIFLPFLPLLPIQMLIQDFLYDFSQIAIPYDNVDKEFLLRPKKWDTKGLGTFMNVMGPVSSVIDVLAFLAFWFILGYNGEAYETYFQTAWFVECLISETLIIHFVRTSKIPFVQSKPSPMLLGLTMVTIIGTILAPILLHNVSAFHFEILPLKYYGIIAGLTALYVILVQIVKRIYIKKVGEWL